MKQFFSFAVLLSLFLAFTAKGDDHSSPTGQRQGQRPIAYEPETKPVSELSALNGELKALVDELDNQPKNSTGTPLEIALADLQLKIAQIQMLTQLMNLKTENLTGEALEKRMASVRRSHDLLKALREFHKGLGGKETEADIKVAKFIEGANQNLDSVTKDQIREIKLSLGSEKVPEGVTNRGMGIPPPPLSLPIFPPARIYSSSSEEKISEAMITPPAEIPLPPPPPFVPPFVPDSRGGDSSSLQKLRDERYKSMMKRYVPSRRDPRPNGK